MAEYTLLERDHLQTLKLVLYIVVAFAFRLFWEFMQRGTIESKRKLRRRIKDKILDCFMYLLLNPFQNKGIVDNIVKDLKFYQDVGLSK